MSSSQLSSSPSFLAQLLITACDIVHKAKDVAENMNLLHNSILEYEPSNVAIYYSTSRLFSRLCGRDSSVLEVTRRMMKEACSIRPSDSSLYAELAYQHRLAGSYGLALDTYRDAAKYDESNVDALNGNIYCQIMQGSLEDAEQQVR